MKVTKRRNVQKTQILDLIYASGQISRVDIAHQTGITAAITSDIVGELIQEHKIAEVGETGPTTAGSGRRRILLAPEPNQVYYVGSELSEKNFTFCLTDNLGKIIKSDVVAFQPETLSEELTTNNYQRHLSKFLAECRVLCVDTTA
ncbi:MAG: hypothetical protein LKE89_03385, partial [Lactobacillaceae bacterium]|nr:hypothetical protein [Lactobacillaceae bacterium]